MAALRVDDKNTELGYLDSGPLQNETYATLFLLHGHTFYSPIFGRLLPLASKYNVRIVAITRRDYRGSTPFTPAELDLITHGDTAAKTDFLKERALEIATFMDRFTQENNLPKISADGAQGGIGLLGWSLGNVQSLAVVGLAQYLPQDLSDRLEPYFKRLILYECPYHSLGFPAPPKAYHPLRDATIPPEARNARFNAWVSGYFLHPGLAARDADALEYTTPSPHRRATTASLSPAALAALTDTAPGARSEDPFFVGADPAMMRGVRARVFFAGAGEEAAVWPRLTVACVWATETTWSVPYGAWALEAYVADEGAGRGGWRRRLDVVPVEGANHFAHWDDPEKLMRVFADVFKS